MCFSIFPTGSHWQLDQIQVDQLQGFPHVDVHLCCRVRLYGAGGRFNFISAASELTFDTTIWLFIFIFLPKCFSYTVFCFQTLLGYVKTLILPVNIVIVAIISGKVRHIILDFDIAAQLSPFECIL